MRDDKPNLIVDKTFEFALLIIDFTELLTELKKYNLSKQLFRCGTSIGANVGEAQNAESRPDFIHKMKIAAKESDETIYWLKLCNKSNHYPNCEQLLDEAEAINRILSKIIFTSKVS